MKRATSAQLDFELPPPVGKHCVECDALHPLSAFLPSKFTTDGLTVVCFAGIRKRAEQDRRAHDERMAAAAAAAPGTKLCKACKRRKPLEQFGLHRLSADGRCHKCKSCIRSGRAKPKQRTSAQVARAKDLAQEPHRRVSNRLAVQLWTERHPQAVAARRALNRAVAKGIIMPAEICQAYGCEETRLDAHHANYSRPLEVAWFCRSHHRKLHAGFRFEIKEGVDRRLTRLPRKSKRKAAGRRSTPNEGPA